MPSSGSTETAGGSGPGAVGPGQDPPSAGTLSAAERTDAFRRTEPKVPPRFVLIIVAVAVVLAVGGVIGERVVSNIGLNPTPASSDTPPAPTPSAVVAPPASPPEAAVVGSSLPAFMGLATLPGHEAPALALSDQQGRSVSLAAEHGDVVVLTFFDAPCQDICPVVSSELVRAASDLGPAMAHVDFLTVNTDPLSLSAAPAVAAAAQTGLGRVAAWHFLTAALSALDTVWKAYGVTINVARTSGLVAHNDVMYFIDPDGRLRYRATPVADEDDAGVFTLPAASEARWGQGIATYVRALLPAGT
ncbi:MAG: SCO family protein [Acidimicrobiales bacterium]|jgi:cytochrome oxidase Cu insertion factor (SCO1/SenC/PrrC family)